MIALTKPIGVFARRSLPESNASSPPPSSIVATSMDFDQVFHRYAGRVSRTLRSLGVDTASVDDATQDVFVVIHAKLGEFEGRSSLSTWIYAVTYRVAQNHRRKSWFRRHEALSGHEFDLGSDPLDDYARRQAFDFVERFCASLKESKRDAFVLCVLEQRPAPEVVELLGVSPGTLYSRVRAVRADFRRALKRHCLTGEGVR